MTREMTTKTWQRVAPYLRTMKLPEAQHGSCKLPAAAFGLLIAVASLFLCAEAYPSIYLNNFASGCASIPNSANRVHGAPQADP